MSDGFERRIMKLALDGATKLVMRGIPVKAVYTPKEVAVLLGKDEQTLARWRRQGGGPKYVQDPVTKTVYYTREALFEYLDLNPSYYPEDLGKVVSETISKITPSMEAVFEKYNLEMRLVHEKKMAERKEKDKRNQKK